MLFPPIIFFSFSFVGKGAKMQQPTKRKNATEEVT